ncbi:MAG: peptide-binding protein [Candidatus Omnitrophica bacterium]|nr:peptide-binding protein [Candidatus Omnitrophota bacterium]MBU1128546.1 peptide-binding protein [Candidatus Omnitrophota bacterium]MBU1783748.1 peptide-binding protein [Candidatus Omnitrophota bacterium]MBU1851745.1 peptide-binding protein [Candidatus Omnitrophota bacterium]
MRRHPKLNLSKRPPLVSQAGVFFLFLILFCYPTYSEEAWVSRDACSAAGIGDARILIPFFADDTSSSSICGLVYNGLTKVDKDLNVVGDLAERWEVSEDGRVITFYLRKNVRWHDGSPFTARDVQFTFETIQDPGAGSPYISGFMDISGIKVLDAHTVRFEYKQPYAPALLKLGMGLIPKHLFEGDPDIRRSPYARAPIGTGPYKFKKWESGQYIILEANQDYFGHVPGIKRYVYRIIPDQSVAFLELVAGGVDSMQLDPYQFRYRSDTAQFKEKINKYRYLAPSYTYIGYNLKDPFLKDPRVRQALSYAINKKEIINAALLGMGEPCTGHFWKNSIYYDQSVNIYNYDPEKARTLFAEAGWVDVDDDGVLEKDGMEFRMKIITNQGNQVREDVATITQRQWLEVGVVVDIQIVAWAAFLDQFIGRKNFQAVILGWSLPVDPDCYSIWHSDSIREGGLNSVSYSNERVDELIENGRREFDPEKRKEIYHEIHRIIARDAPYTFLFSAYAAPAVNKRFRGIEPAPAGISYNFIDWYVPKDEVKYKF